MKPNQYKFDWEKIRAEWEAGATPTTLAKLHGCSRTSIQNHKKKEQWTPKNRSITQGIVAAVNEGSNETTEGGNKPIPTGRSVGQPLGDEHADTVALSKFSAVTSLPAPEAAAVMKQAATEIELMKQHRRIIGRASVVAENILTRLHALVVDGISSDVITFQTKAGEAYHRVPFLGDRESVSDALIKCANTISKLLPLERQAHGLRDDQKSDTLPRITFNMPGVKVISVDGHGKVVKAVDQPALIDGDAADVTQGSKPTVQ